jgi:multicomponent Na+:H+ antiporter subunit G
MAAMHDALFWTGGGFVVAGTLLVLIGVVGVLRFPDVYTRIHAASVTDTGGATLVLLGLGLVSGLTPETLKLFFVWCFIMLATPAAANALANAAYGSGHKPFIGTFRIVPSDVPPASDNDGDGGGAAP